MYKKIILLVLMITQAIFADNSVFELVKSYLPNNPVILEAGAYDGADSIRLADYWKNGHVYAFEPVPELFGGLKNKKQNRKNLDFYQIALGESVGVMPMYISAWNTSPNTPSASSSLLRPKEHLVYAPHVSFYKTINVPVTTIDIWAEENNVNHIDLMCLDMQGYELNALKASPKMFSTVKVVVIEIEFVEAYQGQYLYNDIKHWFEARGFKMLTIVNNNNWFADAIFVKVF